MKKNVIFRAIAILCALCVAVVAMIMNIITNKRFDILEEQIATIAEKMTTTSDGDGKKEETLVTETQSNNVSNVSEKDSDSGADSDTTFEVVTDNGSYRIKVIEAHNTDISSDNEGVKVVTVRCEIENIDYAYSSSSNVLNGHAIYSDGSIQVKDEDGFSLEYYHVSGPKDGEYAISRDLAMGEKAKVALPFFVQEEEDRLFIYIKGNDVIPLDII